MSDKQIYAQMTKVMAEVEPISKDRDNKSQGYKFRGIDDVYAALQHIMAKHGVLCLPTVLGSVSEERQSKSGGTLIYRVLTIRYDFYAAVDGSSTSCTVIGEGQDSGDKASNKAMSVAQKYALLQAFCIPTHEPKDPENDSHEVAPKVKASAAPKPKATKGAMLSRSGKAMPFTEEQWNLQKLDAGLENPSTKYDANNPNHKRVLSNLARLMDCESADVMRATSNEATRRGAILQDIDMILDEMIAADKYKQK